ncbi:protein tyrosine phosphatase [Serratia oryzae]|uniref:arsenate reductase/protein-tyrosine-phosphatase family protein n=1 Tax=Serratia oryzae TaxID=2034155 RepID=UPI0012E1AA47|nr:protein tyrosine phosphatase [Serratia oryzae]
MFNSILVVCVGNICRSPTGERLLRKLFPEKEISSAGINALVGSSADENAIGVAMENSLSLDGHIAQQLTLELCRRYDLILVMEKKHIESVCNIAPEARGKTMLFGHWDVQKEIPDPYRQNREAFVFVYNILEHSANKWAEVLRASR